MTSTPRTTVRAALRAAEPLKAEFPRREVQARVFRDLAANIDAYEAALTEQNTAKEESLTAAASIDVAIDRGMETLRQLDAVVRNKLHNNTATLAAWLSARRVERPPRRNRNNTPQHPKPLTSKPQPPRPRPGDNLQPDRRVHGGGICFLHAPRRATHTGGNSYYIEKGDPPCPFGDPQPATVRWRLRHFLLPGRAGINRKPEFP